MTKRIWAALIAAGVALALAVPVLADHGEPTDQGNCPTEGKVDATGETQEAINDLVLDEGTHVCIKGGQTTRFVTADGESTLKELLDSRNQNDKLQDVSHYTVIDQTTTTTTAPTPGNLPCVVDCGPPDSIPEVVPDPEPVVTTPSVTTPPELPFTGPADWLIPAAWSALGMLVIGSAAAWVFRDRLS